MNYSEFLMANLMMAMPIKENLLGYDQIYPMAKEWYQLFSGSRFDDENKSEYECIQDFIDWRVNNEKEIEEALRKRESELNHMQDAVDDFITYFSSDEDMRKRMRSCIPDWIDTFDHDYANRQITDLIG
jgi:hypothetical protein